MKPALSRGSHLLFVATLIAGLGLAVQPVQPAYAATIDVNTTDDELNSDGDCSLREAIEAANTNAAVDNCTAGEAGPAVVDVINVPASAVPYITSATLTIADDVTINGAGAGATIIDGGSAVRVVRVDPGQTATISDVTIRNGNPPGIAEDGGGIYNEGTLTLNRSTVSGNTANGLGGNGGGITNWVTLTLNSSTVSGNTAAGVGGGIWNNGTLTVTNSTVSGNTATRGGGIYNSDLGTLTLDSSTVSNNTANAGGGIYNNAGATTLGNTIVAAQAGGGDCAGLVPFTSLGFNLAGDNSCVFGAVGDQNNVNPLLGPLADNGGPTQTHALHHGSPAIDTGDPACPATDQRGVARPLDGDGDGVAACDIGAYEFRPLTPVAGEDVSGGVVGPDGLTVGDHCVQVVAAAGVLPVGSRIEVNSDPTDGSPHFGSFQLDHSENAFFFEVHVIGPNGDPITEFIPPLLVQARPCNDREGTLLFDWGEGSRMWREWPTRLQDGWYTTDWYGDASPPPPPPGDQTVTGDQTTSGAASGGQASAGAGQTGVVEAPAAGRQVASAPSIGLPETGAPPGVSGLARIAFGAVIGLGMVCGGVVLRRLMP